jgi:hypothetical protein
MSLKLRSPSMTHLKQLTAPGAVPRSASASALLATGPAPQAPPRRRRRLLRLVLGALAFFAFFANEVWSPPRVMVRRWAHRGGDGGGTVEVTTFGALPALQRLQRRGGAAASSQGAGAGLGVRLFGGDAQGGRSAEAAVRARDASLAALWRELAAAAAAPAPAPRPATLHPAEVLAHSPDACMEVRTWRESVHAITLHLGWGGTEGEAAPGPAAASCDAPSCGALCGSHARRRWAAARWRCFS